MQENMRNISCIFRDRHSAVKRFKGVRARQKLNPNCHACLAARHVEKFREVRPADTRVITANTLNFRPMF